jgi:hypothetical protein
VEHAHLHFVPLPSEFDAGLIERQRWTSFDGSLRALARIAQGHEYITYDSPDGACRILTGAAGTFGSQHMRRILAEGLGCAAKWNWRDHPQPRLADETCLRVTGFLRSGAPA